MVKGKARAAGSFLGGITNNPGIVIIAIVLGGLFLFKDKISEAFASIGEGFGNIDITLPEIKLPDITFPEFNFPEFNFPDFTDLFSGFQDQLSSIAGQIVELQGSQVTIPPDTTVNPDGTVTSTTPPTIDTGIGKGDPLNLFGELRPKVFDTLINLGFEPAEAFGFLKNVTTIEGLNQVLQSVNSFGKAAQASGTAEQDIEGTDSSGVSPLPIKSFLIDQQTQKFSGGGVSFIGGSIFETPITAQSTLGFIIDKLGVSASKAASIRAELIGFTPEEQAFLTPKVITPEGTIFDFTNQGTNVSDSQFQGLTAEQIVLRLLGGNIQNF